MFTLSILEPRPEEGYAADCNGDGNMTAGDAQAIFLSALGIDSCVDPVGVVFFCHSN